MHIHLVKQNSRQRGVIAVHLLLTRLHTLMNAKYSQQQARASSLSRARTIASRTGGVGGGTPRRMYNINGHKSRARVKIGGS